MSHRSWTDILRAVPLDRPIFLAGCCGEPTAVLDAARADPTLFAGRTIISGAIPRVNLADPVAGARGAVLQAVFPNAGAAPEVQRLLPWPYSRLYDWLSQPGNVGLALCQVARDAQGALSLGLAADFMPGLLAAGTPVIGQINPALPAAHGAPEVAEDRFAALFEAETPLPAYDDGQPDAVMVALGRRVADLVQPGDTLQLGLGNVLAAILGAIAKAPRPVRLHAGMISGAALPLYDAGVITEATAGVILGGRALYDRAPGLDRVRLAPVCETHGAAALAALPNLITANAILSIDLAGQATGESINGRTVSAPGGLPDFHRAALAADGGRAVLALRATTPSGKSTIVPAHPAGTRVSLGALDADIVVTEHGTAHLRYLDADARARALIAIAAPEHRDALSAAWAGG